MHDAHATPPDLPETTLPPGRRGAAGAAYTWLKREILSGRIRPGQTLSENEIASQMGVSRTPVREAIIRLESEGLLNVRPQVGTVVAPIDAANRAEVGPHELGPRDQRRPHDLGAPAHRAGAGAGRGPANPCGRGAQPRRRAASTTDGVTAHDR